MLIQQVFDALKYGELSQLAIASQLDAEYPKLLSHMQLGLTSLHKRFNLKQGALRLVLQPGQTSYALTRVYAVSNTRSRAPVRYLEDSVRWPFMDDLLKVESVKTDAGETLPLNEEGNEWSVITPKDTLLEIPALLAAQGNDLPDWAKTTKLHLVYRANHPKIDVENFDIEFTQIDLPESHLEPLLYFIAARVHAPVGAGNEGQVGMNWTARYEAACRELEGQGLQIDKGGENTRLARNGWV
jgi:hypothetical protein